MCLIIFTTRAFDESKEYLFNETSYIRMDLMENLKKFWFNYQLEKDAKSLFKNVKDNHEFYGNLDDENKKSFLNYIKCLNEEALKEDAVTRLKELIKNNYNKLNINKLNNNKLIYDKRWLYIYRIKRANVFAYYHLPSDFDGNKKEFIKALYNDIKEIVEGKEFNTILFLLHDRDLGEKKNNYRIPEPKREQLKKFIGTKEDVEFYAFQHSPGLQGIHGLLKKFPWNDFTEEPDKIAEYIKEQVLSLDCKKKLFELKEELLFCLYPLSFQEEKEFNECLDTERLLGIRIKDLLGEEELSNDEKNMIEKLEKNNNKNNYYRFSDCHNYYRHKGNEPFKNLKDTLKLILKDKHDELLNLIENKFNHIFPNPCIKTIPEFIRYQFDELLNTMEEPIY